MARHGSRLQATADLREVIAEHIKTAQAEAGLKNEDLAKAVGISVRLLQKHRAGDNAPDWDNLTRYARVLEKPVAWFLGEKVAV